MICTIITMSYSYDNVFPSPNFWDLFASGRMNYLWHDLLFFMLYKCNICCHEARTNPCRSTHYWYIPCCRDEHCRTTSDLFQTKGRKVLRLIFQRCEVLQELEHTTKEQWHTVASWVREGAEFREMASSPGSKKATNTVL
jgi:hypothetical protein